MLYEIKDQFGYLVGIASTRKNAIRMANRILDKKIIEDRSIHVFCDNLEIYSVKISEIEDDFKDIKEKVKTWVGFKSLIKSFKF